MSMCAVHRIVCWMSVAWHCYVSVNIYEQRKIQKAGDASETRNNEMQNHERFSFRLIAGYEP